MHIFLSIFQPSGLSKCSSSYAENLTKWNNTLEIACMRKRDCQYQMIHTARLSREPKRHDQWQGCSAMLRALHNTAFKIGKCLYHTQSYQHTTMPRCQRNPIVITNHYHRLYVQECEEKKALDGCLIHCHIHHIVVKVLLEAGLTVSDCFYQRPLLQPQTNLCAHVGLWEGRTLVHLGELIAHAYCSSAHAWRCPEN